MKERITAMFGGVSNVFVAGGAITSLYTNKPINDWDLYPKTAKARDDLITWIFESGYWCAHASSRAITFVEQSNPETKIQVMLFDTFETAEKIFSMFDFTVCMGAFDLDTNKFVLHENFLLHCSQRFLSFNPATRFPYASAWRVRKYEERGYTIGKMEYFKILLACQKTPITTWEELKDQIGGVYGESMDIPENQPYSFEKALEVISNMKPCGPTGGYTTAEEAIACTSGREIPYFVDNKNSDSVITTLASHKYWAKIYDDSDEWISISCKPLNGRQVTVSEVYPGLRFYKKVLIGEDGTLSSIYKNSFKYKLGEYVESPDPYIYCYASENGAKAHYDYRISGKKTAILTLVCDSVNDVIFDPCKPRVKRCKVTGITFME